MASKFESTEAYEQYVNFRNKLVEFLPNANPVFQKTLMLLLCDALAKYIAYFKIAYDKKSIRIKYLDKTKEQFYIIREQVEILSKSSNTLSGLEIVSYVKELKKGFLKYYNWATSKDND